MSESKLLTSSVYEITITYSNTISSVKLTETFGCLLRVFTLRDGDDGGSSVHTFSPGLLL